MTRIAVVEDDGNIQRLITYALSANGYEARGYGSGGEFLTALPAFCPELVLLDIMLPGIDGTEVLKQLRASEAFSAVPVMMLTAKAGEIDKVKTLDLGADDYMTKPFGILELLSRIRALLRRSGIRRAEGEDERKTRRLFFQGILLDEGRHRVLLGSPEQLRAVREGASGEEQLRRAELTLKEFELLSCLLENQGQVLTREQLMQRVWNYDYEGESRTVDMHIKSLRKKLGEEGRYIQTVRGLGYSLSES